MNPATRAFLRAAAEGDANLVRALLAQGTDVNSKNAAGQTALMLSSAFGHLNVVKVLLAAGAERDLQDDLGLTALDWSVNYRSVSELIAAPRAEPAAEVPSGITADQPAPIRKEEEQPEIAAPAAARVESHAGLGGLAGAILRDKTVKVTNEQNETKELAKEIAKPETVDVVSQAQPIHAEPPVVSPQAPTEGVVEKTPVPDFRERVTAPPVVESKSEIPASEELAQPALPPTPSIFQPPRRRILTPLPEDDIPDLPATFEKPPDPIVAAATDDDTWSGREPEDTASPGTKRISPPRILEPERPLEKTPVTSKVKVNVPTFDSSPSTPRAILWLLIILFVGIGAYGGYRLSNYLFEKASTPSNSQPSAAETQPQAALIKLGPVVSGSLAGAELLIPDASYPPSATIPNGSVTVRVQVDQKGTVTSATATDGDRTLRAAAEEAARRAAFSPDKLKDKGRVVVGTITYNFLAPQPEAANSQPSSAPTATSQPTPLAEAKTPGGPKVSGPLSGAEVNLPNAQYPAAAKRNGIAGTVTLVIRVNNSGRVISWRTLEGDQRLRSAAIRAARNATFAPDKLPGKGGVVGTITYTFQP